MPAIPFVGGLYDYAHGPGANISQLLLERGRAQAESAARIGQIWGNTVANLGGIAGQAIEHNQENKRNQALSGVMDIYLKDPNATPEQAYAATLKVMGDPKSALQVAQGLVAFKKASHPDTSPEVAAQELPAIWDAYHTAPDPLKPGLLKSIKGGLANKFDVSQIPDEMTPEVDKAISAYIDNFRKKETAKSPDQLFEEEKAKAAGKAAGTPPEAPKAPSYHDVWDTKLGKNVRVSNEMEAAEPDRYSKAHEAVPKEPREPLNKVEFQDEEAGQNIFQYLPDSEVRGRTFHKSIGSTEKRYVTLAKTVGQTGGEIISKLENPEYAKEFGMAVGRYNNLEEFIGNPPDKFAEVAGLIDSFARGNMSIHGFRSQTGAEQLKQLMQGKHEPSVIIAKIKGLNAFARNYVINSGYPDPEQFNVSAGQSGPANGTKPGGVSPNVQRILDLIKERNAGQ